MSDAITCAQCGYVFPAEPEEPALAGLCPRCLAGGAAQPTAALETEALTNNAAISIDTIRPPLKPGAIFQGFEVLEVLGRGGMGVVYKARQQSLNRLVALKLLNSELATSEEFAARFGREAKVLASLNHPNVVQVFDFGKADGLLYLAMEHVDGSTLEHVMKKKPESARFLTAVRDVARGLERVHSAGLVHRDIKPSNILITRDGTAKISDFGLAIQTEETQKLTQSGMFVGTPHYVSPEHAQGKKVDGRSDLYAVGVILFEGFAGRPPFQAASATALLLKHVNEPPPALYKLAPHAPKSVQEMVRKLLAKNPASRHDTAGALVRDLDRALGDPLSPPKPPPTARKAPAVASAPAPSGPPVKLLAAAAVAAVAVVALLISVLTGKRELPKPPEKTATVRKAVPPDPVRVEEKPPPVEPEPVPVPGPAPAPAPAPAPVPAPQDVKSPTPVEEAFRQAEKLFEQARAAFEDGKARSSVDALSDAAFKAEEAKAKFAAVQEIASDDLQKKAVDQVKRVQQFHKLVNESRLAILNAKGAPPAPSTPAAAVEPGQPAPAVPAPAAALVPRRLPVPDPAAQKDAEKVIRDLFKAEYAKKAPADQQALARKLAEQGRQTADDPKAQFVLLREARDLAAQAGDLETSLAAVDAAAAVFEIDAFLLKLAVLQKAGAAAKGADALRSLSTAYLDLVDEGMASDNYDAVLTIAARAEAAAKAAQEIFLVNRAQDVRKDATLLKDEYARVRSAIEKPGTGDQDAVGRFYCFFKNDWPRGLSLLAASGKPPLNGLAEKDLGAPSEPERMVEVADGWWDLGEKEKSGPKKTAMQSRSRLWYERASGSVGGLTKTKVDKRLETLTSAGVKASSGVVKGAFDLLSLLDPKLDGVHGAWQVEGDGLSCGPGQLVRLQVPVLPPDEYDLTAVVAKKAESRGAVIIGLTAKGTQFNLAVDGHGGWATYLEDLDVGTAEKGKNESAVSGTQFITGTTPHTILCSVRKSGVTVSIDGKKVMVFEGDYKRLSISRGWKVPHARALFIGAWEAELRYSQLTLSPVSGQATFLRRAAPPASTSAVPKGAVDLLALVDPQVDAVKGDWTKDGQGLTCPSGDSIRLQIPYFPPDEYDLQMTVARREGVDGLLVGLVRGSAQWAVTMDTVASGGPKTGFESIDGQGPSGNPTTYSGAVMTNGVEVKLEFKVRKTGVVVTSDGKTIIDWKGNYNRLSLPEGWKVKTSNALFLGAWGSRYQVSRMVLLPVSGQGTMLRKAVAAAAPVKGTLDLLALVDARRDGISGLWSRKSGALVSDNSAFARIEIPYQPPAEYDLNVTFSRQSGTLDINQILYANGRQVIWSMASGNGTACGFAVVRGQWSDGGENPTRMPAPKFGIGETHTSLLQVRRGSIKVLVDGELLKEWVPDWSEVKMAGSWSLQHDTALGLGSYESSIQFQKVELTEISGPGKRLR